MESKQENKEEIYKRLIKLEKEVEKLKIVLNLESDKNIEDQKKYEMNLTAGNRNFLKVLSIFVIAFSINALLSTSMLLLNTSCHSLFKQSGIKP